MRDQANCRMGAESPFWSQFVTFMNAYGVALILVSIFSGFAVGYFVHHFLNVVPHNRVKLKKRSQREDDEKDDSGENLHDAQALKSTLLKGKMDTSKLRHRVAFNPKVEAREESSSASSTECDDGNEVLQSLAPEGEEEEEERMPPLKDRKLRVAPEIKSVPASDSTISSPVQPEEEDAGDEDVGDEEPSGPEASNDPADGEFSSLTQPIGKLHGKLATAQLKLRTRQMQAEMSPEEREYEAQMRTKQLEAIINLMMEDQEKFGLSNEEEIKEQLQLYNC